MSVLRLHVGADLDALFEHRSGPKVRQRPDLAAGADARRPFNHCSCADDRIRADGHVVIDVDAGGGFDRHALVHQVLQDAPAHQVGHQSQVLAAVDGLDLVGHRGGDGGGLGAALNQQFDGVRQIIFALRVLVRDAVQGRIDAGHRNA